MVSHIHGPFTGAVELFSVMFHASTQYINSVFHGITSAGLRRQGMKDLKKTYELSQPYHVPKTVPHQIPYRHLVTIIQIGQKWDGVKNILLRTKQIPKDLKKEDEERLRQRVEHVRYWLDNFAPEQVKFEVQKNIPNITLTKEQKTFLLSMHEKIPNIKWESEDIHNLIYSVSEEKKFQIKIAFQTIYQVILGKDKGPRAGYFLSNLDKDFVLKRFKEAVK